MTRALRFRRAAGELMPARIALSLAAALALTTTAAAQPYACPPERTIDALASAVARVAPMFVRPRVGPPVETAQPRSPSRDEWREAIIADGRAFCAQYPDDQVCPPSR